MLQRKFLCRDLDSAKKAIGQIGDLLSQNRHKSAVLTFYETGFEGREIEALIGSVRDLGFPELQIAGISATLVAELMQEKTAVSMNLIMAEEADIEVVQIPCRPGGESAAAEKLRSRLDAHDRVRAVELLVSNMKLNVTCFMEDAMRGHEDTVLFGTSNTRNLMQIVSVSDAENSIEVENVAEDQLRDEFVAGEQIMHDGFLAVIFAGEKLEVQSEYALGWKPIGRKFSVELGTRPALGETVVTSINSMPAVDIYREYLGVYPDSFFVGNVCEFPLIVERDGIDICLIPLSYGENGELFFMMKLHPGEKVRFTFASHDEVLYASRRSLEKMERFRPEALFLTPCGNRISFLKEDAHIEWDEFDKVAPDYALMHGACELYYHKGKGGILNSAHLTIGMRETENVPNDTVYEHPSVESLRRGRSLSLSDRMSTFLEKITSELLDTAVQAQNANNAKSAFLSHMSHEIRTPINAILGMDEMILKESDEEVILDYADSIRSAGNNLLGIVNDILDFSKIEAGKMSIIPAEYELKNVIKDMYNVVRLRAEDKGLKVTLNIDRSLPSVLYGDSTRIKQVVTNILTNAVKYTEVGTVTLSVQKLSDGAKIGEEELQKACPGDPLPDKALRMRIAVKDTGIGIRPEDMEKLFEEYERFDEKRNRSVEGTGLGMSITKELLDLMGSKLTVESTYGKGSEFSFVIVQGVVNEEPFGDVEERLKRTTVTPKKRVAFTAEDASILVVDDTNLNLILVKELLKHTRIRVDTATSGEEALRMVRENTYDVIFLDHLMPNMNGIETLKHMNELADNRSASAPVISLTSNAPENAREEYRSLGFRDYLSKPFQPEELEDMLFYYIPPEKIRTVSAEGLE